MMMIKLPVKYSNFSGSGSICGAPMTKTTTSDSIPQPDLNIPSPTQHCDHSYDPSIDRSRPIYKAVRPQPISRCDNGLPLDRSKYSRSLHSTNILLGLTWSSVGDMDGRKVREDRGRREVGWNEYV